MLLPTDIDQFTILYYVVYRVNSVPNNNSSGINYSSINLKGNYGFNYLPKEFFNMAWIKYIDMAQISAYGSHYIYILMTRPINHRECRWNNFINLDEIRNFGKCNVKGNKDIITALSK